MIMNYTLISSQCSFFALATRGSSQTDHSTAQRPRQNAEEDKHLKSEERAESEEPEGVFTEAECEPGVCGRDNQRTALRRQGCQGYQ